MDMVQLMGIETRETVYPVLKVGKISETVLSWNQ